MTDPNRHPSMREFDYFAPDVEPGGSTVSPIAQEGHQRLVRRRSLRYVMLMTLTFAMSAWVLWGFRADMRYAFSTNVSPRDLGDVVEQRPADMPHDAYVRLQGITEHRGMTQELVRGMSLVRQEYWYFRLLGSRGVFIETPKDPQRFGIAQRVDVVGRLVDPAQIGGFSQLIAEYQRRFSSAPLTDYRILRVDYRPGEGRWPYIVIIGLLLLLFLSDLRLVVRIIRTWR
ncbi:MAG: hypothetical protein R3C68_00155 [Myxococcota bacterium]